MLKFIKAVPVPIVRTVLTVPRDLTFLTVLTVVTASSNLKQFQRF